MRAVLAIIAAAALAAPAAAAQPAGDATRGEKIYERCAACHSLDVNRAGPKHRGLVGRTAGTVPGFNYSSAMKRSGLLWDETTLDRFLANPLKAVPGTRMYVSVTDEQDRADLIAFLKAATPARESALGQ